MTTEQKDTKISGNTVYKTKEYAQFKHLRGNRTVDQAHVAHLKAAITENNLLDIRPIIVNKNMVVIDGQHRLQAAKELDTPIFYVIREDIGLEEVQTLNTNNKNWSVDAYLKSYIEQGNKDYAILQSFKDRWKISTNAAQLMLGGHARSSGAFQRGLFKIKGYKDADAIMEMVYDFGKHYKGFKRRSFLIAVSNLYFTPGYDHARMMGKLEYLSTEMVDCCNAAAYLRMFEKIYNYKSRDMLRFEIQKNNRTESGHFKPRKEAVA